MSPSRIHCTVSRLRPWRPDDRGALVRHANDREVWCDLRLLPHPYAPADRVRARRLCAA